MKRVLVVTSASLPLPAVDGGAAECLTNHILNYNDSNPSFEFTTYSVKPKSMDYKEVKNLKYTKFRFVKKNRIKYYFFKIFSRLSRYKMPDYFSYQIQKDINKRNEKYDYILVENQPRYTIFFKRKNNNAKMILHLHNDWVNRNSRCAKEIVKSCDKIIVVSDYIKQRVLTVDKRTDVQTVLNGIEAEKFTKIEDEYELKKIREKYNIEKKDFVYIFSGKLKYDKGALEAVQAFVELNKKYENIKLLLVGSSFNIEDKNTPYINKIEKIISNNDNVIMTGFVDYSEMVKLYSIADVQLVPSIFDDPCPLVVLEGMSMGLVIIATRSGGIPEEVNDKCAILLERGNTLVQELKGKMQLLLNNSEITDKMKNEGKERAKLFTNEIFCANFIRQLKILK